MNRVQNLLKHYQKISVIDNGVGFNQQYAEKVFNIFQRLNNLACC